MGHRSGLRGHGDAAEYDRAACGSAVHAARTTTVTSLGHNIFDGAAALCDVALHPSDVTGDPGLGAFVDTGAPGGGHVPLLAGSPAIDAADTSACPVHDQLGRTRVGPCDIGAVEYPGSVGGPNPSPSGTRLPPAPAIIDSDLASWTIGPNLETLRNGVHAGGGYGSTYLWYEGVLYVVGTDANWWRWTGSGWIFVGPNDPAGGPSASPSGTRLPPATAIVDNDLASWTIGPNLETLRNGVHAGGGYGSSYLWYENVLYVVGTDANWWRWTGSSWIFVGPNDPAGGPSPSPSGTRLPPATAIVDNDLASWTIGPNLETLRNGVHAGGGYGSTLSLVRRCALRRGDRRQLVALDGQRLDLRRANRPELLTARSMTLAGTPRAHRGERPPVDRFAGRVRWRGGWLVARGWMIEWLGRVNPARQRLLSRRPAHRER